MTKATKIPIALLCCLCMVAYFKSRTSLLSAPVLTISSAKSSGSHNENNVLEDISTAHQSAAAAAAAEAAPKRRLQGKGDDYQIFRIRPSIILFGDSHTQISFGHPGNDHVGWGSLLASAYARRADVFNRGFSGYNTDLAVERLLPSVFTGPVVAMESREAPVPVMTDNARKAAPTPVLETPLFVTVFFGSNDMSMNDDLAHVPIRDFGANMDKIVQYIQTTIGKDTPIVLLTPPPFAAEQFMQYKKRDTPGHSNARARAYGFKVKQIAKEYNLAVVDTWQLLQGTLPESEFGPKYLYDGMHANAYGNKIIYKGIMNALQKRYPEVLPMMDGAGKYGDSGIPFEEALYERLRVVQARRQRRLRGTLSSSAGGNGSAALSSLSSPRKKYKYRMPMKPKQPGEEPSSAISTKEKYKFRMPMKPKQPGEGMSSASVSSSSSFAQASTLVNTSALVSGQ